MSEPDELRGRAAVAFEAGAPLRVEEVVVRAPGPGEVRVRIQACGICASDLHVWRTGEGIEFPVVLGHEAAGVVESSGAGVDPHLQGQRVVLSWIPRCGSCRACRAGRAHLCSAMQTHAKDASLTLEGAPLGRYMNIAGLSEWIVLPAARAIPLPEGLPTELACTVGCGVTTGFGAAALTGEASWRDRVAVFGCGGVGLSAIQAARVVGAAVIVAVDPNRDRLALAAELGAHHLVSPDDGDPVAAVRRLTEGGVDLAIEAAGSADVARQAFDALAPGGRAVVVGLTRYADEIRVPMASLLLDKSLRGSIHGSADPARDFPRLFELARSGALRLDALCGPDYPLEAANEAFEALAAGRAVRPRVIFQPWRRDPC